MKTAQLILLLFIFSFIAAKRRHSGDIYKLNYTFVEAHRGVNREMPQNTMVAFKKAVEYGIEAIETDLWICKDGVAVLVHGGSDGEIKDYYDHSGKVTELTWAELSTYRTKEGGQPMPRFDELIEYSLETGLFINLEIKDKRYDIVFKELKRLIEYYNFFDQIEISSFHAKYYDYIVDYNERTNGPHLYFATIYSKGNKFNYDRPGSALNVFWTDATKETCTKAKQAGMSVMAWFGMGDKETDDIYLQLISAGVHVICSNQAKDAKKFRDNYYGEINKKIFGK